MANVYIPLSFFSIKEKDQVKRLVEQMESYGIKCYYKPMWVIFHKRPESKAEGQEVVK